jgi:hypothetical protein
MEHDPLIQQMPINRLPEVVSPQFAAHWHPGLTNEQYHMDRGALSSSGLKTILRKTPAHFKAEWIQGSSVDKKQDHFRYGSLCHMALLEPEKFKSTFVLEPVFEGFTKDGRLSTQSKDAKDQKKLWYANLKPGALVVTPEDYKGIQGSIASILNHEKAKASLVGAQTEISGYFRHKATGIRCRIRPDILHLEKKVLIDFKTTEDASPDKFSRSIDNFMYHVSLVFYGMGIEAITGTEPDIYALLAVEKDDPYCCAFYALDRDTIETAKAFIEHGMALLKTCLEKNQWPGYQAGIAEQIGIPKWGHLKDLPMYEFDEQP